MPRSIALSTLLCYYPPELSVSALARVGELFGIAAGTMWAALSGLVAAKNVAAEGGSTDSPSDWSGGSRHRITARHRG
jgi:hypothetical protein